jgi:SAM-dependent methyltransferase
LTDADAALQGGEPLRNIHRSRERAAVFGSDAQRYDRARPSYPAGLIDDLMADRPVRVLDVGCGTGKAARLLAARGCDVVGVEPDERMAVVARSHGVTVETAAFESWDAGDRTFDLVMSGQAWHWVDPTAGPAKAAAVLREGGRFAAFWNRISHGDEVRTALERAYQAQAPELVKDSVALGTLRFEGGAHLDGFAATRAFTDPQLREYRWELPYSRDEWLELLETHSDHLLLEPARRERLMAAVAEAIDQLGGSIVVEYHTAMVTATRMASGG